MALTQTEQQELAAIESEMARRKQESEQQELMLIEQELERRRAGDVQQKYGASPAQAGIESFGQGATFGYLPQIQAGVERATQFATKFIPGTPAYEDEKLREQGFQLPEESYLKSRDENIARIEGLQEANPKASIGGTLAGALSSGIATAGLGAAGQAATRGKQLYQAAKTGLVIGALQNPGDTEGEYGGLQLEDRAKGAATGAVLGTALTGAGQVIGKVGEKVSGVTDKLKKYSELKALKASGAMLKDFRKAFGNKKAYEMGRELLDSGVVGFGDDVAAIATKAEAAKKAAGEAIGGVYDSIDEAYSGLDFKKLTPKQIGHFKNTKINLEDFAIKKFEDLANRTRGLATGKKVLNEIGDVLDSIKGNGSDVSLRRVQEIRSSIDDMINYNKANNQLGALDKELLDLRNSLQDMVKAKIKAMDRINGTKNLKLFEQSNKKYNLLSDATKMAKDKLAREESNAAFGLRERISGGAGLAGTLAAGVDPITSLVVGGAAATATKIARQYGTSSLAKTVDMVSKALAEDPAYFGRFAKVLSKSLSESPDKYVRAIMELEKNPEFRRKIKKPVKRSWEK